MEKISGQIKSILFSNSENGYSVIKLEGDIIATGKMFGLNIGDHVELEGEYIFHQRYGKQFQFERFYPYYPASKDGIIKYLGSGLIAGIGPSTAEKIVDKFGLDTFEVLDNNIDRLTEIEGIGEKKLEVIKEGWASQKLIKDIMLFLQSHNVSVGLALKIYQHYQENAITLVTQNPYRMIYDIWGVGFKTADSIGKNLGFDDSHPERIKAGLVFLMNDTTSNGNVYLPTEELKTNATKLLNCDYQTVEDALSAALDSKSLIQIEEKIYLPFLFKAEKQSERNIDRLVSEKKHLSIDIYKALGTDVSFYSEEQLMAIEGAISQKVMVLTGGPGTGKTTVLKGIIDIYNKHDYKILLAAPTGRAAKRMSQVIGKEAKTIHRLLEFDPLTGKFTRSGDNPLEADLIVVDEMSMVDILLFDALLDAIDSETTFIMVGDSDQLPSVGAGNVLNDLIESGMVPVKKLTQIFRQAEASAIVVNSHRINKGVMPIIDNADANTDFFFINEPDSAKIPQLISELCSKRLPDKYGFDPVKDIQVLTPMYRGDAGADNLNKVLQKNLNYFPVALERGERVYKQNDKVMQLKNNYDNDVYNGDIGTVLYYDKHELKLKVDFEDKEVPYDNVNIDELTLAYAITVHKSQGSEYPCIILPLVTQHYMMLQRNLLYTAVTRAKKMMILIGDKKAVQMAVSNNSIKKRYTSLFK